jgi:hypothetical protein
MVADNFTPETLAFFPRPDKAKPPIVITKVISMKKYNERCETHRLTES